MHLTINKKTFKGFTLVELIIVITILSILATIAYISFQLYTKDARDGIRMSDIKQIYNGLSIYKTQTEKTLLPDNYINIQSGTTTISYQGYAGASVLRTLKISGGKDPGTKDYYIYTTDVNTKKAQLMTYMETSDKDIQYLSKIFTNQVNALTDTGYYQDKKVYVYGDKIGILTNTNKIPLQETTSGTGIDVTTLTGNITTYFGGNVYSSGISTSTGITLINQINGAITGKLPCNGTIYDGYTITSLQDSQTGTFIKAIPVVNGSQTGTLSISCSNGNLNYSSKVELLSSVVCNSDSNWDGTKCNLMTQHIFNFQSSVQTFTMPFTGNIKINAWGGQGGTLGGYKGGDGGSGSISFIANSGDIFKIFVGQSGNWTSPGGGATYIIRNGSVIMVLGGGGGAGNGGSVGGDGGGGGPFGTTGGVSGKNGSGGSGGSGGASTGVGVGGNGSMGGGGGGYTTNGSNGSSGYGGKAFNISTGGAGGCSSWGGGCGHGFDGGWGGSGGGGMGDDGYGIGGGGGGGWNGGNGGGAYSGGGGGSSYLDANYTWGNTATGGNLRVIGNSALDGIAIFEY